MVNQTKYYEVENIKAFLAEAKSAALIDYQGLTAEQLRQLRNEISQVGGQMMVSKNTLFAIALKQSGIDLASPLVGPTALVVANEDEVLPLKAVDKTKKQFEKPEFKLGIYQNKLIPLEELLQLISLPPKTILLAQFVGGLANPLIRVVYAMKYHQIKFILAIKAIAESKGGEN